MKVLLALLVFCLAGCDSPTPSVPEKIQKQTVMIATPDGTGSGVVVTKPTRLGDRFSFVWTAAHVVSSLIEVTEGKDKKQVVKFSAPRVIVISFEHGIPKEVLDLEAKVLAWSDPDKGEDLALLQIIEPNRLEITTQFADDAPELGGEVFSCGSPGGLGAVNSITSGVYSFIGRSLNSRIFDQVDASSAPGSSGGGTFSKKDGKYLGMVLRIGPSTSHVLVKPIRVIRSWAAQHKLDWALNSDEIPVETGIE